MPSRQRQFSQIRSQTSSRCISQISDSVSIIDRLSFHTSTHQNQTCIGCFNKSMALSKRQEQKRTKEQENRQHTQTIKQIINKRDYQREHRERLLKQASQYNKSLASSQIQSMKNLKQLQDFQIKEQINKKNQQLDKVQQDMKKSRLQLKQKYHRELKTQLLSQRSSKQLQLSQSRISDIQVTKNNLKLIDQNERHFKKMKEETKKCQQQNKALILERSYRKTISKQEDQIKEKQHNQTVQKQFQKFTEFQAKQSKFNKKSSSLLSSSYTENPEDVFNELKRIQTDKKMSKIAQRQQNHIDRMAQLRRMEEQKRAAIQSKISKMKSYVEQLTVQVKDKKQRKAKEVHQEKHFKPEKSRVDYFTEESEKKLVQCGSCERVVEKKLIGSN